MAKQLTELEKDIALASILGAASTAKKITAPCQCKHTMAIIAKYSTSTSEHHNIIIGIFEAFNKHRNKQLTIEGNLEYEVALKFL